MGQCIQKCKRNTRLGGHRLQDCPSPSVLWSLSPSGVYILINLWTGAYGLVTECRLPPFFKEAEPCSPKRRSCHVHCGAPCSLEHSTPGLLMPGCKQATGRSVTQLLSPLLIDLLHCFMPFSRNLFGLDWDSFKWLIKLIVTGGTLQRAGPTAVGDRLESAHDRPGWLPALSVTLGKSLLLTLSSRKRGVWAHLVFAVVFSCSKCPSTKTFLWNPHQ